MLSGGDVGYGLAEVDEVLGCLVVQTVEHHEAELERDPLRYTEPMYHVRQKLHRFIFAIALPELRLLHYFLAHIYFNKFPIIYIFHTLYISEAGNQLKF